MLINLGEGVNTFFSTVLANFGWSIGALGRTMASLGAETTLASELSGYGRVWAVRFIMASLSAIETSTTALTRNMRVWAFGLHVAVEQELSVYAVHRSEAKHTHALHN